jgi:hypothetical membrane protein
MRERSYALFGIFGPMLIYFSIGASLVLSPWFSWESSILSDLGNSVTSGVAPLFNFGLLLSGFLLMVYALTAFKEHAKYSSVCLLVSTFLVELLAAFNIAYGSLHYAVAVPHFVMLSATSIIYTIERKSVIALATFLIVLISWTVYGLDLLDSSIAVPETISKIVLAWILVSAIKIYIGKPISSSSN